MKLREPADTTGWSTVGEQLDDRGYGLLPKLLTAAERKTLQSFYGADKHFRSTVTMARHGFGRGEYRYFAYPLPDPVARLRAALYEPLAAIANRWAEQLQLPERWPPTLTAWLAECHAAGQRRPTPLLLNYRAGDYNTLHQDLYGDVYFPLQVIVLLSEPAADFEGGELVLVEQRPRRQSRALIVPLAAGDGVVIPVRERPRRGARGYHRAQLRHGVAEIRSGQRMTLGLIFHDAA